MAQEKSGFAFSKRERLRKNPEFVRVQRLGKRLHCKNFILAVHNPDARKGGKGLQAKLGVTVTTKTEPLAVKRNRVKRLVREAFRKIKIRCLPSLELVVIAKTGASLLTASEVQRQIYGTLKFNGYLQ